jgi:protein SCO1/2
LPTVKAVSHENEPATNATPRLNLAQIPDFALTNELGRRVHLRDIRGQAVGLTFFFTRCPIPEFCPRLSKNFAEASQRLLAQEHGPTNWHLFSISFDPLDTPAVLRNYALQYHYDSNHWSFLTGDLKDIRELTKGFGMAVAPESGLFNHDFRTAIFDCSGWLQALWPFGGNMSDSIVREMAKAACSSTESAPQNASARATNGVERR